MAKQKRTVVYRCTECGGTQPRWLGRCPQCGAWNSFEEAILDTHSSAAAFGNPVTEKARPVSLSQVSAQENVRIKIGIGEFDRVLGGGAMKKSAILLGGEPGIGKSTLLIQSCADVHKTTPGPILYISGEESAGQIKCRAERLNCDTSGIEILCTMRLEDIKEALIELCPVFVIIDSIQTVYSAEAGIVPGTVSQLKYCANELVGWVKEHDSVLILAAHITKDGSIAGPKSLEHLVDTVISFERNDDEVRFLRALKNRFGSVDEIGIFAMTETGLECVGDPSTLFITKRTGEIPSGIAYSCILEGSRSFLVEIQALTVPAKAGISRVYSEKIDANRVARIAAVLEKKTKLKFSDQDIYVNVAGGIKITESAVDAALAAALYSARTDTSLPDTSVLLGELSLAGEIRPVRGLKQRVKTAAELGFANIIVPATGTEHSGAQEVDSLAQLIKSAFSAEK